MTARPILFSGPMVRALLAGRKTQTRRIAKHPLLDDVPSMTDVVHENPRHAAPYLDSYCGGAKTPDNPRGMTEWWCWWTRDDRPGHQFKCPYGKPGDLLWARETWGDDEQFGGKLYRATHKGDDPIGNGWRPSIHMPRSASRITLEITGVKIERLKDISEADAKAEGCGSTIPDDVKDHPLAKHIGPSPRNHFAAVWERINGETGPGSWEANPWVWALEFRVHTVNVDEFMRQVEAA